MYGKVLKNGIVLPSVMMLGQCLMKYLLESVKRALVGSLCLDLYLWLNNKPCLSQQDLPAVSLIEPGVIGP